ncbi:MAG: flavin reductase family protein [Pseudomonadota bacterium]
MTDPRALRNALGAFATGVTVVTTRDADGAPWGFTANSFTSVSLDPPLVLFCLAREAGSMPTFQSSEHFAINILADHQAEVSMLFASGDRDKFDKVAHDDAPSGSPRLADVVAWFDCRVHERVDGGDHVIFVGRVTNFGARNAAPLGYCRGAYVPLALDHRMFQAGATSRTTVGVIVEHNGKVLLKRRNDGRYTLPEADRLGQPDKPDTLLYLLAECGLHEPAMFVFSVMDDDDHQRVTYRTEISNPVEVPFEDLGFVKLSGLDGSDIADASSRQTLERYARERRADSFGVYVGSGANVARQALR